MYVSVNCCLDRGRSSNRSKKCERPHRRLQHLPHKIHDGSNSYDGNRTGCSLLAPSKINFITIDVEVYTSLRLYFCGDPSIDYHPRQLPLQPPVDYIIPPAANTRTIRGSTHGGDFVGLGADACALRSVPSCDWTTYDELYC